MLAPPHSGSTFYNYKKQHSIVLMAVADAEYKFTYIDVGANGRIADGGVFKQCTFARALQNNLLHLPSPKPLPGRTKAIPFVLVADDAFAMAPNLMKPFTGNDLIPSKRIFNYRLSRARRVVENAFGILSARFRVFRRPIILDANKTKRLTLACCALHNMLLTENRESYATNTLSGEHDTDEDMISVQWSNEHMANSNEAVEEVAEQDIPGDAKGIREEFENYFISDVGAVPWQWQQRATCRNENKTKNLIRFHSFDLFEHKHLLACFHYALL